MARNPAEALAAVAQLCVGLWFLRHWRGHETCEHFRKPGGRRSSTDFGAHVCCSPNPCLVAESPAKPSLYDKATPQSASREIRITVNAGSATSLALQPMQDLEVQATPDSRGTWISALSGSLSRSPKRSPRRSPRSPFRQRSVSPKKPSLFTAADAIVMNTKGGSMVSLCSHALQVCLPCRVQCTKRTPCTKDTPACGRHNSQWVTCVQQEPACATPLSPRSAPSCKRYIS